MIRELLSDYYQFEEEELYCSILPTATQYARNAIFSGLMPCKFNKMFPQFWVEEEEKKVKNLMESELLQTQIQRFRKNIPFVP
jgi:hypothetical protein